MTIGWIIMIAVALLVAGLGLYLYRKYQSSNFDLFSDGLGSLNKLAEAPSVDETREYKIPIIFTDCGCLFPNKLHRTVPKPPIGKKRRAKK